MGGGRRCTRPGRKAGHALGSFRDAVQRREEIRHIHQRQQQGDDPKHIIVREQRQQAQGCHNLELQLLPLVGHALGQRMQVQEEHPCPKHCAHKHNGGDGHKYICAAGRRDEEGQWGVGCRVQRWCHDVMLSCRRSFCNESLFPGSYEFITSGAEGEYLLRRW